MYVRIHNFVNALKVHLFAASCKRIGPFVAPDLQKRPVHVRPEKPSARKREKTLDFDLPLFL